METSAKTAMNVNEIFLAIGKPIDRSSTCAHGSLCGFSISFSSLSCPYFLRVFLPLPPPLPSVYFCRALLVWFVLLVLKLVFLAPSAAKKLPKTEQRGARPQGDVDINKKGSEAKTGGGCC